MKFVERTTHQNKINDFNKEITWQLLYIVFLSNLLGCTVRISIQIYLARELVKIPSTPNLRVNRAKFEIWVIKKKKLIEDELLGINKVH